MEPRPVIRMDRHASAPAMRERGSPARPDRAWRPRAQDAPNRSPVLVRDKGRGPPSTNAQRRRAPIGITLRVSATARKEVIHGSEAELQPRKLPRCPKRPVHHIGGQLAAGVRRSAGRGRSANGRGAAVVFDLNEDQSPIQKRVALLPTTIGEDRSTRLCFNVVLHLAEIGFPAGSAERGYENHRAARRLGPSRRQGLEEAQSIDRRAALLGRGSDRVSNSPITSEGRAGRHGRSDYVRTRLRTKIGYRLDSPSPLRKRYVSNSATDSGHSKYVQDRAGGPLLVAAIDRDRRLARVTAAAESNEANRVSAGSFGRTQE